MKRSSLLFLLLIIVIGLFLSIFFLRDTKLFQSKSEEEMQNEIIAVIRENDVESLEEMLGKNYKLDFISSDGFTPLEIALNNQSIESANALLKEDVQISESSMPLIAYCIFIMNDFSQYHGSDKYQETIQPFISFIQLANKKYPNEINSVDENKNSALHYAANRGIPEIIQLLIELGADTLLQNQNQETPLMLAIHMGHHEAVGIFLQYLDRNSTVNDSAGNTPLILAAMSGRTEIIDTLLEYEIEMLDKVNFEGKTALIYAAEYGYIETVEQLLGYGANKSLNSTEGKSALDYATDWNHGEIMKLLQ